MVRKGVHKITGEEVAIKYITKSVGRSEIKLMEDFLEKQKKLPPHPNVKIPLEIAS